MSMLVRRGSGVSLHMGDGIYATVEDGELLAVPDDRMVAELLDRGGWEITVTEEEEADDAR
jgi:hypothetical protein